jgi:hypothetical protein
MYIEFEKIPGSAKVWVYQGSRKFTDNEAVKINEQIKNFTQNWAAHGKPLLASGKIYHDQFIVLAVDESQNLASGCSIDSSVGFIRQLEEELGINFLDRTKIAFFNNNQILTEQFNNVKQRIQEGIIKEDTLTFNNTISYKEDFEKSWVIQAKNSWMKRFF